MDALGLLESFPCQLGTIPDRPDYVPEALSESLGLWLLILETSGHKEKFASQVSILRNYFRLLNGTLSWRLQLGQQRETVYVAPYSATIDDMRVIGALLEAEQKWGIRDYRDLAMQFAQALKKYALVEDLLMHQTGPSEKDRGPKIVDLSYLDLPTMTRLGKLDGDWQKVKDRCRQVLKGGMRPTGLFFDKYDVDKKFYYNAEKNLINSLLCAIHLAEQSSDRDLTILFLKKEWAQRGKIYGRYDPDTGQSIVPYESVAVYALAMRLALLLGDMTFAEQMRARILLLSSGSKGGVWRGSLVDEGGHSFDHLQALFSLLLYAQHQGRKTS